MKVLLFACSRSVIVKIVGPWSKRHAFAAHTTAAQPAVPSLVNGIDVGNWLCWCSLDELDGREQLAKKTKTNNRLLQLLF